MFEDVTEASDALEFAQDAANRHGVPFYVVNHETLGGKGMLRITSVPTKNFLEKVDPRQLPLITGCCYTVSYCAGY